MGDTMPDFSTILLSQSLRGISECAQCGCGPGENYPALRELARVMAHESTRLSSGQVRVRAALGALEEFVD